MRESKYEFDDIFINGIFTHLEAFKKKKAEIQCNTSNLKNNLIIKKEKRSESWKNWLKQMYIYVYIYIYIYIYTFVYVYI